MKFIKTWVPIILLIASIGALVVTIMFSRKSIEEMELAISERDLQIGTLEGALQDIGMLSYGYVLNTDVRAGETVKLEYFEEVSVPENLGLGIIKDVSDLEGAYFRTSLSEGTVLTTEDINYFEVQDSQRYVDIVLDQLPIGVEVGDYIDIRITFPYGEDFICLSSKRIEEINNSILKLILNENEIVVYNSMLLDRVLYAGTQIYAVEYIDAGSQQRAETFYPINNNQSELLLQNPNALEISKQEMILKRQAVEEALGGSLSDRTEDQLEDILDNIETIRERTQDKVVRANEVIEDRRAEEARRAAEEAGESTSNGNTGIDF